jgi:hypothetical protein
VRPGVQINLKFNILIFYLLNERGSNEIDQM